MRRVRRYVTQARRSRETKRLVQIAALPVAALIAIVFAQIAVLSGDGEVTLAQIAPMVWQAVCLCGLVAVLLSWFNRNL